MNSSKQVSANDSSGEVVLAFSASEDEPNLIVHAVLSREP